MLSRLRKIRPAGFVAGFVAALVVGGGTAYAANGGSVIIGKTNYGTATTGISNSYGSAASFSSKSGYAPFRVNRSTKVPYLNSDLIDGLDSASFLRSTGKAADANKLDGLDSTAFGLASGQTGYIAAVGAFTDVDGDGVVDVLMAEASCPSGTKVTGGGVDNWTGNPTMVNSPAGGQSWDGVAVANQTDNVADDLVVYVVCYNPRGAVPGASSTVMAATATVSGKTAQSSGASLQDRVAAQIKK